MTWMRSTGVLGTLAGFTLDGIIRLCRESADLVLHYMYLSIGWLDPKCPGCIVQVEIPLSYCMCLTTLVFVRVLRSRIKLEK